eukprot:8579493-Lingulodinium_polyedra.AAC.1
MDSPWFARGRSMDCPRAVHEAVHGQYLDSLWTAHGQSVGSPWIANGLSIPWIANAQAMDCSWT